MSDNSKTIKLFATLREVAGAKEIVVPFEDGETVRELLRAIHQVSPELATKILDENGQLSGFVTILVQGRNVEWLQGLDTAVAESDEVSLIPPAAGG